MIYQNDKSRYSSHTFHMCFVEIVKYSMAIQKIEQISQSIVTTSSKENSKLIANV